MRLYYAYISPLYDATFLHKLVNACGRANRLPSSGAGCPLSQPHLVFPIRMLSGGHSNCLPVATPLV